MATPDLAQNNVPNTALGTTVLKVARCQWSFAVDGGTISTITPLNGSVIPVNSIIYNASITATTTCVGASGTMAFGLSAGGGNTTSLAGATAVASLAAGNKVQSTIVPQTASGWIKLSAPAQVTVTIATTNFSAGVVEIYVFYIESGT